MRNRLLTALLPAAVLGLSLVPAAVSAQPMAPGPVVGAGSTLLSISAEGRSTRQPDLATFSAGVSSSGRTAGEALAKNSADMAGVIAALKRAGIADKDIQTSNLSLNPVYADMSGQPRNPLEQQVPRIIGYQANNTVSVRQRNLAAFGRVIDTLVSAGANQVNGPSFEVDNPDAALDEARLQAMTKARARANLYAKAAGLRVVRVLTITESGGYAPQPPVMFARAAMAEMAGAPPVAAGEVALSASVAVTFELAP